MKAIAGSLEDFLSLGLKINAIEYTNHTTLKKEKWLGWLSHFFGTNERA
jgi:hypothetical protein